MKKGVFIFWTMIILLTIVRILFSFDVKKPDLEKCLHKTIYGKAVIVQEPERKDSGQIFVIKVYQSFINENQEDFCAKDILVKIKVPLYPRFVYGDDIDFQGKLSKPYNFYSDDGRQFDYEGYLAKDNIFYEIKSGEAVFIRSAKKNVSSLLYFLKRKFVANLERVLGEPYAALASGLVVGEKSALGNELLNDFRKAGLIHIVVLSGYNITIVADVLRKILSFLPRVWGIFAGGLGIAAFGILVGGGATVIRSCLMSGISLSADLTRRDYNVYRALFLAGFVMIIINPLILFNDPSFQLSFMATFGLIVLSKPVEDRLFFLTEKFGLRSIVASTLATQIFVSPYIIYMMGQVSVVGFISNILVLPFIPITMLFVFLTGITGFISLQISTIIAWIAHLLLYYEITVVKYSAKIPLASIHVEKFSGWIIFGIYIFYGVIFLFWKKRKQK